LRVGVQLVDAGSGRQLWSERFDRKMEELFDLQDEIVRSVVMTCEHRIIDREFEAHRNKPRHNWAAYEYVLQARYFLRGYDSAPQAEEPAKRAIEIDPGNSQAHAQLAWVSMNKFWTTGDRKHIGTAYDFARAALERDDMEPLAHSAMSLVAVFKSDGGKALMHAERAVALNPNDVIAVNERSQVLVYLGRHSESLEGLDSILKRDPFPPQWYWETRGMVLFQLRRYSESVDAFRQILNQHPWERAHVIAALAHDGRMAEAKQGLVELLAQWPDMTINRLLNYESYIDRVARNHYAEGLRKAGVPESSAV
jgi:tetratricopeptide (TPR) repeat protein